MSKILVLIPTLHQGGAERVVSLLTIEWCKRHNVSVAVFDGRNCAYRIGGELVDLKCAARPSYIAKLFNIFSRIRKIKLLIEDNNPDYIISFMESASIPTYVAATLSDRLDKLIITIRTNPNKLSKTQKLFINNFYSKAKIIVAVSEGVHQALIEIGIKKDKIITIPNPVEQLKETYPQTTNWVSYQPYILAVGRLGHEKGFDRLIVAFSKLKNKKINLIILGEGILRQFLKKIAVSLSISDRVHLLGNSKDVTNAYHHAELFVLSSRHEGWPNVLMEAMANNCPVISFNCPYGPSEIIRHKNNGILVEEGNIDELCSQIDALLESPEKRRILSAKASDDMKQFSTDVIAARWLTLSN